MAKKAARRWARLVPLEVGLGLVCLLLFSSLGFLLYGRFSDIAVHRAEVSAQQNAFSETAFVLDFDASDFAHGFSASYIARLPGAVRREGGALVGLETVLAPDMLVVDSAGDPPGELVPEVAPLRQTLAGHDALVVLRRGEPCPCDAFARALVRRDGSILAIYQAERTALGPLAVTVDYLGCPRRSGTRTPSPASGATSSPSCWPTCARPAAPGPWRTSSCAPCAPHGRPGG